MNGHLTDQQLIDYQFKLASEQAMAEAAGHLQVCEVCRRRLEQLVRKFAALDLLREEATLSETLLARTVEAAGASRSPRILSLYRYPWLGAVAAVVVVGLVWAAVAVWSPGSRRAGRTVESQGVPVAATDEEVSRPEEPARAEKAVLALSQQRGMPPAEPAMLRMRPARPDDTEMQKPPFAPASAIELVVLPRRENVQLTIYNGADLTLIREKRNLTLKRGWNWLQFMWADTRIDPTSLALEPMEQRGRVEVRQLVFPPRLRELGRWLIRSEISGQVPFELSYLTSGLSWRAFYMGTLSRDEMTMRLQAYVRVDNASGEDYEDARTRLLVGRVHLLDEIAELAGRQYAYGRPQPAPEDLERAERYFRQLGRRSRGRREEEAELRLGQFFDKRAPKEVVKEGLSEYFLYTIEGTETIPDQWGKRLLSFEADDVPVTSLYKYDEQRWGGETIRFLSFANDEEHELGETPIPNGTVRVYSHADEQGHLAYVGGTGVKYIPVGEEVELNLGPARLVEVKPVLMEAKNENFAFDRDGDITGWDEVRLWRIDVTNARMLPIEVEVTRGFETPYWVVTADVAHERHDATRARFKVRVEPRSTRSLAYTVRTYHGTREQTFVRLNSGAEN